MADKFFSILPITVGGYGRLGAAVGGADIDFAPLGQDALQRTRVYVGQIIEIHRDAAPPVADVHIPDFGRVDGVRFHFHCPEDNERDPDDPDFMRDAHSAFVEDDMVQLIHIGGRRFESEAVRPEMLRIVGLASGKRRSCSSYPYQVIYQDGDSYRVVPMDISVKDGKRVYKTGESVLATECGFTGIEGPSTCYARAVRDAQGRLKCVMFGSSFRVDAFSRDVSKRVLSYSGKPYHAVSSSLIFDIMHVYAVNSSFEMAIHVQDIFTPGTWVKRSSNITGVRFHNDIDFSDSTIGVIERFQTPSTSDHPHMSYERWRLWDIVYDQKGELEGIVRSVSEVSDDHLAYETDAVVLGSDHIVHVALYTQDQSELYPPPEYTYTQHVKWKSLVDASSGFDSVGLYTRAAFSLYNGVPVVEYDRYIPQKRVAQGAAEAAFFQLRTRKITTLYSESAVSGSFHYKTEILIGDDVIKEGVCINRFASEYGTTHYTNSFSGKLYNILPIAGFPFNTGLGLFYTYECYDYDAQQYTAHMVTPNEDIIYYSTFIPDYYTDQAPITPYSNLYPDKMFAGWFHIDAGPSSPLLQGVVLVSTAPGQDITYHDYMVFADGLDITSDFAAAVGCSPLDLRGVLYLQAAGRPDSDVPDWPDDQTTNGPSGFGEFCVANPDHPACVYQSAATVAFSADLLATLQAVNDQVNGTHVYSPDQINYRKLEHWAVMSAAEPGDCEDFALTKIRTLIDAGVPAGAIKLATGKTINGVGHAWLEVQTTEGNYALDINYTEVKHASALPYTDVTRQYNGLWWET